MKSAMDSAAPCLLGVPDGSGESLSASAVARRIVRAELSLTVGDAAGCAREARHILAHDHTHVGALEVLAKALWQSCDFAELLPVLDRLIGLNPYEPGYHSLRGAVYQALGRYGDAVRSMARGNEGDGGKSLQELQNWQSDLVAALLQEDAVFRAHYSQNPEGACLARGFAFVSEPAEPWMSEAPISASVYMRPS